MWIFKLKVRWSGNGRRKITPNQSHCDYFNTSRICLIYTLCAKQERVQIPPFIDMVHLRFEHESIIIPIVSYGMWLLIHTVTSTTTMLVWMSNYIPLFYVYVIIHPHHNRNAGWFIMMTSSNENIFRVTGHLCGEFTGHRWIPRTKAVTRSLEVFFDLRLNKPLSKQSWGWWFETPSRSLWRHCNVLVKEVHATGKRCNKHTQI